MQQVLILYIEYLLYTMRTYSIQQVFTLYEEHLLYVWKQERILCKYLL